MKLITTTKAPRMARALFVLLSVLTLLAWTPAAHADDYRGRHYRGSRRNYYYHRHHHRRRYRHYYYRHGRRYYRYRYYDEFYGPPPGISINLGL